MSKPTSGISIFIRISIFLALAAGTVVCVWMITSSQLTNREATLVGLIISGLSVLAGWVITDLYSSSQYETAIGEVRTEYRNNLRVYALKASEKVRNLSNELNKLATYLDDELTYTDYRTADEELAAKEERIESAIHIVRTLKTVNDTAMSDWEGVIGDELDERREEEEEKQTELRQMIARLQESLDSGRPGIPDEQAVLTRGEMSDIRRQLERAMFSLSNTTVPKALRKGHKREEIEQACPNCGSVISYRQRPLEHSVKSIPCENCGEKLMSRYSEKGGFKLEVRRVDEISVKTPCCGIESAVALDTFPGVSVPLVCEKCGGRYRVLRTRLGVDIKKEGVTPPASASREAISEDIIEKVAAVLPPQPWPSGTHKSVAESLELDSHVVSRAIDELIKRGRFFPQFAGVLYTPMRVPTSPTAKLGKLDG